ncbi:MAG: 50S ribosomal protein L10 [Chloroflexi bacterium]|nr:50S ribosomal protein L10 [Chloroflexota bacterium]
MAKVKTGPKVKRKGGGVAAKREKVGALAEHLTGSSAIVVTEYRGLTVGELQDLRRKLRAKGVDYHVVKNTLFSRAAADAGREAIKPLLTGPTAIAVPAKGQKIDEVDMARSLVDELRTFKALKVTGALVGERAFGPDEVTALSKLPGRPQLQAMLIGTLEAPLATLTRTLGAPFSQLIHVLTARGAAA